MALAWELIVRINRLCPKLVPTFSWVERVPKPVKCLAQRTQLDLMQHSTPIKTKIHRNMYHASIGSAPPTSAVLNCRGGRGWNPWLSELVCSCPQTCDRRIKSIFLSQVSTYVVEALRRKMYQVGCHNYKPFIGLRQVLPPLYLHLEDCSLYS